MTSRLAARVLVVGTSAGGVEALTLLAAALPADFPAPVLVVLHVPAFSASNLAAILDRAGPLHAEIDKLGLEYLSRGELSESQIDKFRSCVQELSSMYLRHIAIEDTNLFPAAAKALSEAEKQAIAQEMAKRRSVPLVPLG